jgi:drug/metabolite transporter (DMT)-like permease
MNGRTLLAITVTVLFWSSAFAAIGYALHDYGPGELALLRFGTASIALAVYAPIHGIKRLELRDLPVMALMGFLGVTVYHLALNFGQVNVSAGQASLLIATSPVFTALLATIVLRERLPIRGWVGIFLSFAGAVLISTAKRNGDFQFNRHALLILLSAVVAAVTIVIQKGYLKKYGAMGVTSYMVWIGTFLLLPFAGRLIDAMRVAHSSATWAGIYLGVFPAALAYVTWAYVLSHAPASRAASCLYLIPALSFVFAWWWLGEVPQERTIVGGAMAIVGVILVNARRPEIASEIPAPVEAGADAEVQR